ncbi:MAG: hypothetical protein A2Y62_04330 [Candidatus Fischerbacteria bacterium RBG_13_37_8]|uniref:ABC-2 type transporter domain-containing protein n=1 Tax=Candidatus Fischerbacteria bacterium RBG_13_37_8 TaxID=1817863 RepID=A0A1F5VFT5_9BACT|nr:MAG: hypothetical protein A2Y62_04330 [Candidatus Fischerbacteria bacterium RBG_13_37_8]
MGIREKGYYNWAGQLKVSGMNWFPIFRNGIEIAFKKKWSKMIFFFTFLPFAVFLLGIYVRSKPELKILSELVALLENDATIFNAFYSNGFLIFMLMIMCVFIGSELISGDMKFNAFSLYFSRPLDRKDYLMGKYSIIMFFLLLFTLAEGIFLLIFKFIFEGSISIDPRTLLMLIAVPVLIAMFFSSLSLMVSSISRNSTYVKILLFLIYVFSDTLAEILNGIFHNTYFFLFSIRRNIQLASAYMFDTTPVEFNNVTREFYKVVPGWMSIIIILAITLLSLYIMMNRIRKAEAQNAAGS